MGAKQKLLTTAFIMVSGCMMVSSCVRSIHSVSFDEGENVVESRNLQGFDKIMINGSPTVYYTQTDSFSVEVKGPQNVISDILTDTKGDALVIRNRGKVGVFNVSFNDNVSVYVSSPDLVSVTLNGSGDFFCDKRIDTDEMNVTLRGSGDVNIEDLLCDHCEVELIGSGDMKINRLEAKDCSAALVGSGDIDLNLYHVDKTWLSLRGSGDIDASFDKNCLQAECELNGSGDISLSGKLKKFSQQTRGSGSVDTSKLLVEK